MDKAKEVLVYFHGSFGFRMTEEDVEVYVPNIEAHANLIGTWNALYDLKKGYEYKLEGIARGTQKPKLNEDENVVFDRLSKPEPGNFFCKITLPFPLEIESFCPEKIDPDTLFTRITSIAGGKIPHPSQLSHIQLYRYSANAKPLQFEVRHIAGTAKQQSATQPPPIQDEEGARVFHLFSEPPHVFPTADDRERVVKASNKRMAAMNDMGDMGGMNSTTTTVGLDAIRTYAPFTKHAHIALQDVLRMFPEARNVEVNVPDAVEAADSPPPGNLPAGIRPKDLRSLYHLYPHFEGGQPACNPGEAEGN